MIDSRGWIAGGVLLLALVQVPSAEASPRGKAWDAEETRIAGCIRKAADGKAWLEKTLWGLRDQEGGWIGAEVANADGSHDLGPLQVNSWWVSRISALTRRPTERVRWWLTHDACFNVDVARWIFLSGLAVGGDYWKAVGVYHSATNWRQRSYALGVARHMERRFGSSVFGPFRTMTSLGPRSGPEPTGTGKSPSMTPAGLGHGDGSTGDRYHPAPGAKGRFR